MCMILVCENNRPEKWQIERSWEQNPDGAGIVFPCKTGKNVTIIKGLGKDQITKLADMVPLPFAIHFRFATVGEKCKELTHPFPIHPKSPLCLTGSFSKALMHNGHWGEWEKYLLSSVVSRSSKIPSGRWSDSRAIASLMAIHGEGIANFTGGRVLVHSGKEIRLYGSGWQKSGEIMASGWLTDSKSYGAYGSSTFKSFEENRYDYNQNYSWRGRVPMGREIIRKTSYDNEVFRNDVMLNKEKFSKLVENAMIRHSGEDEES